MVGSATRSAVTASSAQEVGTFRRVIGREGVERDMISRADWMAAIQSNAVDEGCLFFDPEAQRWRRLSELDLYSSAVSAIPRPLARGRTLAPKRMFRQDRYLGPFPLPIPSHYGWCLLRLGHLRSSPGRRVFN
jgi:hypothetical protein